MVQSWLEHVATDLQIDPAVPVDALLDAARVVAHSVERKATPLTTYLIGYAAASGSRDGLDPDALCRRVTELARSWGGDEDDGDR